MATDWLRYANSGAIRNQPLSADLVKALSFLPEMGLSMQVFSGGQDAEGPNRTGSHRHDHGGAGDVFFYKDGKQLDWANPEDRPIFEQVVQRARANGVTGFGAGDGYMRPGSMHIGFGNPGVWGAGGKGANAPDWLTAAFNGAPAPTYKAPAQVASAAPAPSPVIMGSMSVPSAPVARASGPIPSAIGTSAASDIPSAVRSVASAGSSDPMSAVFGMMMAGNQQGPQFAPAQVVGPSPEQATALSSLVAALKNRLA